MKYMLIVLLSLFSFFSLAQTEKNETTSAQVVSLDDKLHLVVTINHDKGWHTYWKNPGDSGIASQFKFNLADKPQNLEALEWPIPEIHIEAGDILTIGYEGVQHFFFKIPDALKGRELGIKANFLICKDICIPGEGVLKIALEKDAFASTRPAKPFEKEELKKAFDALPQSESAPNELEYYLTLNKDKTTLDFHYSLKGIKNPSLSHKLNWLTPFPQAPFGFKREALYYDVKTQTLYGKLAIEWDGDYQEPVVPLPADGKFPVPYDLQFLYNSPNSNKVSLIKLKVDNFSAANETLLKFYNDLNKFDGKTVSSVEGVKSSEGGSFFYFAALAFLGGLILNLMPCVLPVISLKLFGLIKHQNLPRSALLKHNMAYTLGVVSTFMILGGVVAAIKLSGEQIGWGFQLQSPAFILAMMIILFVMSLNLFGLFEFITPGGKTLGAKKIDEGFSGDFFSGILTTILSTPCSAPFLGTALTFAFTTSTFTIFGIFLFVGLGLAFPFLMTAIFPSMLNILPRPGMWMEKLKYFLGLSLVVTIIWLYDVFQSLVDMSSLNWKIHLLFASLFFAIFFYKKITTKWYWVALVAILPSYLLLTNIKNLELKPLQADAAIVKNSKWASWSESKLQELQKEGKWVFMDFTAEWCLTCKVNKKLVLETSDFEKLAQEKGLTLVRADWTRRDDNITKFLQNYKIVGVPAYFIQKPDGTIIPLGETISIKKIESNLN